LLSERFKFKGIDITASQIILSLCELYNGKLKEILGRVDNCGVSHQIANLVFASLRSNPEFGARFSGLLTTSLARSILAK
jgi:hypothetical protein